jgi:two-component system CheB/CheR fusion protein
MNTRYVSPKELQEEALTKVQQLSQKEILEPYSTHRICKNGKIVTVTMISTSLVDETGKMYAIATTERITGKKKDSSKRSDHDAPG